MISILLIVVVGLVFYTRLLQSEIKKLKTTLLSKDAKSKVDIDRLNRKLLNMLQEQEALIVTNDSLLDEMEIKNENVNIDNDFVVSRV